MKLIICLLCILCTPAITPATELLIVHSVRDNASAALLRSITSVVPAVETGVLVLSDYAETDLPRIVREEKPDVILAIGEAALKATRKIRGIPVVAVMTLTLGSNQGVHPNVTGVDIRIDPARYMTIFKALGLRRIGVNYDPARNGVYLARAQRAAAQAGIELALRPARDSREALKSLESLKGNATDGLWLVPDATTMTPINLEANFTFSLEQTKPVISYTGEHLAKGAAVTLSPDWVRVGLQAGEIVRRMLEGATPQEITPQSPQSFALKSNDSVLSHLGISIGSLDKHFPKAKKR